MSAGIDIPIKATVDASQLGALEGSLASLRRDLAQAKKDFESAAPGSSAWSDAIVRVTDLDARMRGMMKPLQEAVVRQREVEEGARKMNAVIASGVNPWTTASAAWTKAQHALEAEARAARAAEAATRNANAAAASSRNPWTTAASSWTEADANLLRLSQRNMDVARSLDHHGDAATKAAAKGADFGQAMLQGSRGLQDFAVAGVPGVVNNLESLATALGMTAGAAGGITLVAVGLDLLIRNWDKIKTAFGSQEDVQSFWSAITPDEAARQRIDSANTALENTAKNLERIAEARKASIQAQREEDELLKKKSELWKNITPTPEERGDLPPLPGLEPTSPAMREAQRKLDEAKAGTSVAVGKFNAADQAVADQQRKVDNINKVSSFDDRLKLANAADNEQLGRLRKQAMISGSGGAPVPRALQAEIDAIVQRMQDRWKQMRGELENVPGLTDGMTGDATKDREILQQRSAQERDRLQQLKQQQLEAASEAERAAREQAEAERGVAGQRSYEREQRGAAAYKELGLPPAPGQFAGADERAGLTQALAQQQQAVQQSVQQAMQVVQASGANIEQGMSAVNQGLASTLTSLAQTVRTLQATVQAQQAEIESLRDANRR